MNNQHYYAVIMAGGIGSRFWPYSRTSVPKQFLDILGVGKTLLQLAFERVNGLVSPDHVYVVTGEAYKALVCEQLPEVPEHQVLTEPFRRNTAPCIAYANKVISDLDPEALVFVAPSDHLVLDKPVFLQTLQLAYTEAQSNEELVTIGIKPSRPDTGYGYIEIEGETTLMSKKKVVSFKEKPDLATAKSFLERGCFMWNSGMFCWSVKAISAALQEFAPEVFYAFESDYVSPLDSRHQGYVQKAFTASPSISIDYAVIEKAHNVFVIPSEFGWSDVGTWGSLHTVSPKDENGNVVDAPNTHLTETRDCTIKSHRTVVCDSVDGLLIVDTPDVLLVCKRDDDRFKSIAQELSAKY